MASNSDADEVRVFARTIRPEFRQIASRTAWTVGLAWLAAFPVVTWFTDGGAQDAQRLGLGGWFVSWLVIAALAVAGTCLGYRILLNLAPGNRGFTERRVLRLALGDSFLAMSGGFALAFFPLTFVRDVMAGTALAAMLGFLFTAAVLVPTYIERWRSAAADGQAVID